MTGKIRISCKSEDRVTKKRVVTAIWEARKEDMVEAILQITTAERQKGFRLSLRALHYKLVSRNLILNYLEAYQKLSSIVDDCKYSGLLDWDAIKVDGARGMRIDYSVAGIPDALESEVLSDILEQTITGLMDLDQYHNVLEQEEADKKKLVAFINTL